jgi:hypothetical protein
MRRMAFLARISRYFNNPARTLDLQRETSPAS